VSLKFIYSTQLEKVLIMFLNYMNFKLNSYIFLFLVLFFTHNCLAQVKETNYFCSKEFVENYSLDEFRAKALSGVNVNEKCKYSELPALFTIFNTIKHPEALQILEKHDANFTFIEQKLNYSKGRNLLFDAVRGYLTESIPFLIKKGVSINKQDAEGNTPLMRSCISSKNPKMIDELIDKGADINQWNFKGENCLSIALQSNNDHKQIKKIFDLTSIKKQKNCKQGYGSKKLTKVKCPTLLSTYLSRGAFTKVDHNFLEFLLKNGSNPNEYSHEGIGYDKYARKTPLITILSNYYLNIDDKIKLTKSLLKFGANLNLGIENTYFMNGKISYRDTPIFYAISLRNVKDFEKHKELISTLINSGAQLNVKVDTGYQSFPLRKALNIKSFPKFKDMTTFLWSKGADINQRGWDGETLIFKVIGEKNELKMVKHLLNLGAKINLANKYGNYLAHTVAKSSFNPDLFDFLISKSMNFKIKGKEGFTPLMEASLSNFNYEVVKKIIDSGGNVNAKSSKQQTSLMWAVKSNKNPLITELLINKGANVNARTFDGFSPIMFAAYNDSSGYNRKEKKLSMQLIKMLLDAGANINNVSDYGSNVLHAAVTTNITPYLTLFLIENGVNHKQRNTKGETALDLIKKNSDLKDSDAYWKLHQLSLQ